MASSVSCGVPAWCDGPSLDANNPFRQFDVGTRVLNAGTASAVAVPGGVFPGLGAMQVTAGSGLSVQVAAGYCCVPSPVANNGGYIFGPLTAATLTLAAADNSNPRTDLIVARVYDTGNSASYCDVEVVTGTPATPPTTPATPTAAIPLATVSVPVAAVALASGAIADQRSYVVAPGGILPIANAAAAPAVPSAQLMFDLSRNLLVQGTGTAGSVSLLGTGGWSPALAYVSSSVNDSSGRGNLKQITSVSVTTDGATDIEIYYKWPGFYVSSSPPLMVTLSVSIDGTVLDQTPVYVQSSSSGSPGNGGSARYYTSSGQGTTPTAATHTIAFDFQSASNSLTTTMACSSTALGILRVAPAVV
jgi:hypothetical protein